MNFLKYFPFINGLVLASSFVVINHEDQCMLWSERNYGCTGYSAPFSELKGRDCSSLIKANPDDDMIKLDICGTKKGHQIAWVTLNEESTVTFHNIGGDTSSCRLDKGLSVGSKCSISNTISSQSFSSMPESNQYSVSATSTQADQKPTLVSGSSSMKSQSRSSASVGRSDEAETPVLESTSISSQSSTSLAAVHSARGTPIADRTSAPASVSTNNTHVCRRSVE